MKTPDKEEAPATPSVSVEEPGDIDLDESVQIIPGETPQADEEVQDEIEAESPELPEGTIIQPEVGPPDDAQPEVSVTVLTSY